MVAWRARVKEVAGQVPWAADAYQAWFARGRPPSNGYALPRLEAALGSWTSAVDRARPDSHSDRARRVLVLGFLPWWLEFSVALGLLLASRGVEVDLAFLPYRRWTVPVDPFDASRQRAYLRSLLRTTGRTIIDLSRPSTEPLPEELARLIARLSFTDVEYTLQREAPDVERDGQAGRLWALRRARNHAAAANALRLFRTSRYDSVVIPNGSILEFGAVYHAARYRGLTTVTYEFGEQRERVWICRNGEAMRLETAELWEARGDIPLTPDEHRRIEDLVRARQRGVEYQQFARLWQRGQRQGSQGLRQALGLDASRPVVLLATNVVGDSLALNRQIFTEGMADWLSRTLQLLANRSDVQTIVRVHPGELLGAGMTSEQVVRDTLPDVPPHVRLIPPESKVNTYDLIETAHLGLVYTSTAGLEMAMHGVPVITAGRTHYRSKGFTDDPETFADYVATLTRRLDEPAGRRLRADQIDLAWRYAHRFFFEYPFPFPWHLLHFWKDMEASPLEALAQAGGAEAYREALDVMAGAPVDWGQHARRA
ncbi:MAG TPA: hypothetical protein VFI11_13325 [Anaerolineales bacterium]|nr:hypothetical protein [Anaerolineales bacterium]